MIRVFVDEDHGDDDDDDDVGDKLCRSISNYVWTYNNFIRLINEI